MSPDILAAIKNIVDFRSNDLRSYSTNYLIRVNAVGEQLEFYFRDAICGSFKLPHQGKDARHRSVFSLLGNQNNPPDMIIRGGDAFEIKKIQSLRTSIALNSSPPKDRLHRNDPMVTKACRNCEGGSWDAKDIFYVVGCARNGRIKYLFMVQGRCYAAEREVYDRIASNLKSGIENSIQSEGIEGISRTVELGRVNRVDPLGITNLRIRGMWMIENPVRVFSYIYTLNATKSFSLAALMTKNKFDSFSQQSIAMIEGDEHINLKTLNIKNPNNPADQMNSVLITSGW